MAFVFQQQAQQPARCARSSTASGIDAVAPSLFSPARPGAYSSRMQSLLSPLPAAAKVTRRPVAPPEVLASAHGAAIAGMEQIFAQHSADGTLRIALVVLDRDGTLLGVNDTITTCGTEQVRAGSALVPASVIESVGGSFAKDGAIRGTRWISRTVDDESATEEEPAMESTPSPLSDADVAGLRALAAELVRRGG